MELVGERFRSQYRIDLATSEADVRDAQRVRYRVYCLERGFEPPSAHPDGLEGDPFDARSAHAVVRHRSSGQAVATCRLVLADPADPERPFPVEHHCGPALAEAGRQARARPRRQTGEISRFAVLPEFRRGREAGAAAGVDRVLTVGLIAAVVRLSRASGVRHWYALMEPQLIRLLGRLGAHFSWFGEAVEHRGVRRPCFTDLDTFLERMRAHRPEHWSLVAADGAGGSVPGAPVAAAQVRS